MHRWLTDEQGATPNPWRDRQAKSLTSALAAAFLAYFRDYRGVLELASVILGSDYMPALCTPEKAGATSSHTVNPSKFGRAGGFSLPEQSRPLTLFGAGMGMTLIPRQRQPDFPHGGGSLCLHGRLPAQSEAGHINRPSSLSGQDYGVRECLRDPPID